MVIGFTSGCFDLLHEGHVRYLERCAALCDQLIVGVDSDDMVREAKGPLRPIIPQQERLRLVGMLTCVDDGVLVFGLGDLKEIVSDYGVNKVFKHEGFAEIENVLGVAGTEAELVIVPDIPGLVSTTEIIQRILSRYHETI